MGRHVEELEGLESITSRLPGSLARHAMFILALEERRLLLERLQLPDCPEADGLFTELEVATSAAAGQQASAALEAHMRDCTVCQARVKAVEPLGPMPPFPHRPWASALSRVHEWVSGRPEALQAPLYGALALTVLACFRVLMLLIVSPGEQLAHTLLLGAVTLGAAFVVGFCAGAAYQVAKEPTRRLGKFGPYAAGMCAVAGGILSGVLLTAFVSWQLPAPTPVDLLTAGVAVVIFGLVVGHQLRAFHTTDP